MAGPDPLTLHVTGLKELRAALKQIEPDLLPVMRDKLKAAGEVIAADARHQVPVGREGQRKKGRALRPGAARDSIRITAGGNSVYLIGGRASVPYFGWLDFGGKLGPKGKRYNTQLRRVIKGGRYLYPAIARHSQDLANAVGKAFDEVATKAGLT